MKRGLAIIGCLLAVACGGGGGDSGGFFGGTWLLDLVTTENNCPFNVGNQSGDVEVFQSDRDISIVGPNRTYEGFVTSGRSFFGTAPATFACEPSGSGSGVHRLDFENVRGDQADVTFSFEFAGCNGDPRSACRFEQQGTGLRTASP